MDRIEIEKTIKKKGKSLVDAGRLLKPGGRKKIRRVISKWKKRGLNFFVVTVNPQEEIEEYFQIYDNLSMGKKDILILFNRHSWWSFSQGVDAQLLKSARDASRGDLRINFAAGLTSLINATAQRARPASIPKRKGGQRRTNVPAPAGSRRNTVVKRSLPKKDEDGLPIFSSLLVVGCLGAGGYFFLKRRQKIGQMKALFNREAEKIVTVLDEGRRLLEQIEGLSQRHGALFDRYSSMLTKLEEMTQHSSQNQEIEQNELARLLNDATNLRESALKEKEQMLLAE